MYLGQELPSGLKTIDLTMLRLLDFDQNRIVFLEKQGLLPLQAEHVEKLIVPELAGVLQTLLTSSFDDEGRLINITGGEDRLGQISFVYGEDKITAVQTLQFGTSISRTYDTEGRLQVEAIRDAITAQPVSRAENTWEGGLLKSIKVRNIPHSFNEQTKQVVFGKPDAWVETLFTYDGQDRIVTETGIDPGTFITYEYEGDNHTASKVTTPVDGDIVQVIENKIDAKDNVYEAAAYIDPENPMSKVKLFNHYGENGVLDSISTLDEDGKLGTVICSLTSYRTAVAG